MLNRILRRLASDESGYTLMELLIVIVILSILLLVAVPAYLLYRDDAYRSAATANAKDVVLAAGLYQELNWAGSQNDPDATVSTVDSGYQGMTVAELQTYASNLPAGAYVNNSGTEAAGVTARAPLDATHFCVYATAGRWFAYQLNPSGSVTTTTIAADVCT